MASNTFSRGLDCKFVQFLNDMYKAGGWWRNFVDDTDTFLAIRDNYVSIYYQGNSMLKLEWKEQSKTVIGKIHYKYLLRPSIGKSSDINIDQLGNVQYGDVKRLFIENIYNVEDIKSASQRFGGPEKKGIHHIALDASNAVVDLEIAFSEGRQAPRIDLATLSETSRGLEIRFYEAKHFNNKELRADGDAEPKVIGQIQKYHRLLSERHETIVESYRTVCENLLMLCGLAERYPKRRRLLEHVVNKQIPLSVDEYPRLLVFGFDQDQKDGDSWKPHRDKLKEKLLGRVRSKGKAEKFQLDW